MGKVIPGPYPLPCLVPGYVLLVICANRCFGFKKSLVVLQFLPAFFPFTPSLVIMISLIFFFYIIWLHCTCFLCIYLDISIWKDIQISRKEYRTEGTLTSALSGRASWPEFGRHLIFTATILEVRALWEVNIVIREFDGRSLIPALSFIPSAT